MRTIILLLFCGIFLLSCEAQQSGIQSLSAKDFKKKIDTTHLLDVRTAAEYSESHIPGAKNFDWNNAAFIKNVEGQHPNKEETIFVYCRSGGRSSAAAAALSTAGYASIINLSGGIIDWEKEGFPLE